MDGDRDPINAGIAGEAATWADQGRWWGCRRTRTGPTRSAAIWLAERPSDR
jgi:hypothetical protein